MKKWFSIFLAIYHLSFAWFAWKWVTENGGDALGYWFVNKNLENISWFSFLKPGTEAIQFLTFPLVKYLNLPFWGGFLLFSSIGLLAVFLLYRLIGEVFQEKFLPLGYLLLLLPGMHFWTSVIGKEPFIFLFTVLLFRNILLKRDIFIYQNLAILLLIGCIRPHFALLILLSGVLASMVADDRKKIINPKNATLVLLLIFLFGLGLWFIQDWGNNPLERLMIKYEKHQRVLSATSAYIPLHEYSYFTALFLFYFSPLTFFKEEYFYKIFSVENWIFLLTFGWGIIVFIKGIMKSRKVDFAGMFAWFYLLIFATAFIFGYENYGIIYRTKMMVLPFMFLILFRKNTTNHAAEQFKKN